MSSQRFKYSTLEDLKNEECNWPHRFKSQSANSKLSRDGSPQTGSRKSIMEYSDGSSLTDDEICKTDLLKAREFLHKGYPVSTYDHLSEVVQSILVNRVECAVDVVESLSKDVKDQRFLSSGDYLRDVYRNPKNICAIKKTFTLYKSINEKVEDVTQEDFGSETKLEEDVFEISTEPERPLILQNFIDTNNHFKQAGFGLPDWEIFDLTVSVTRLLKNTRKGVFSKIRFFGKTFGQHHTYYVLETELTLEEVERCKQIQLEKEQALLAAERDNALAEELDKASIAGSDKALSIGRDKASTSIKTSLEQGHDSGSTFIKRSLEQWLLRSGSASGDSEEVGIIKQSGSIFENSRDLQRSIIGSMATHDLDAFLWNEAEKLVEEIIQEIIREIMMCIAMEMMKSVEAEMPTFPPEPVNKWTPPKDIPSEEIGEGLNKTVFWVCHSLEDDWICLPNVTPKHINVARQITHGLTGNLETEMISYPPFNGKERDYLRAQLARINSATSVSPMGFYKKGLEGVEDDDDEEDAMTYSKYVEGENPSDVFDYEDDGIDIKRNTDYKIRSMTQLANESMFFWVHHRKEIKNDGRITWWEEEEEDLQDEDLYGVESEHTIIASSYKSRLPRPLFKPLSKETPWMGGSILGWTVSKHPTYFGGPNIVALKSLRWPGAVAYATVDGKTDHMYIGFGLKSSVEGFRPASLPKFGLEYQMDTGEVFDPCVTDEEEQLEEGQPPLRLKRIQVEQDGMEGSDVLSAMESEDTTDSNREESSNSDDQ